MAKSIEDEVESLDDYPTQFLEETNWKRTKMYYGCDEGCMQFYSRAMKHACELVNKYRVGIRAVTQAGIVYWEVWIKDD